ncbi:Uncharacterized protein SCF082_LOCUS7475 [Durusdinium trenchii]|uniref:Uncharacterized protein n=1 Tax=Durusdinium trenchii TaxID=1381693 RepID=A0ABP0IJK6_9DINO
MKRGRELDGLYGGEAGKSPATHPVRALKDAKRGKAGQSKTRKEITTLLRRDQSHGHAEHKHLHPDPKQFAGKCARCRYLLHRQSWRQTIASVQLPGQKQLIWLNEKPHRLGSSWGIGCDVCASMLSRLVAESAGHSAARIANTEKLKRRLNTKWGRYEISSLCSMQASTVRTECFPTLSLLSSNFVCVCQAFSGAVPQLDDYLRVWRYVKSSQSFNSIESSTFTEAFISQKRSDPMEVKRRAVAQIVKVMREQVRKRKVECLLRATTMTLVVDDKKDHRVILFHSNLSHEPGGSGLIQVLRIAEQSIAGHEEDYAVRMADTIERGLQLLATPLHGDPDAWVFTHLREITKHFTADGCPAVQKAGRILAQRFPNLTLVHRDHAHAIRLAAERPCAAQEQWAEVREALFGSAGLVPDVMNSVEWKSKLWAIQHDAQSCDGWQKPLATALKHLNYSPVRWNSQDAPLRRFAALLVPIALLLAVQSQDSRLTASFRQNCQTMLQRLTPAFLVNAGLASDYSSEMLRLKCLFLENHILDDVGEDVQTVTRLICQQAMQCPPILYGPKVHYLWPKTSKDDFRQCVLGMHAVVESAIMEVDSELCGFALDFAIFDIAAFHHAKQDVQGWRNFELLTKGRLERLLRSGLRHAEWKAASREWWAAAHQLHQQNREALDRGEEIDNRHAWRQSLEPGFAAQISQFGEFRYLSGLVQYYLGFTDSSTGAERALSQLVKICSSHLGPLQDSGVTASMLLEITLDGPADETDFCQRFYFPGDETPQLRATDFSLELAQLWRSSYGSRFRLYKKRKDAGQTRPKKAGTEVEIVRSQARAADRIVQQVSRRQADTSATVIGLRRRDLPRHRPLAENPAKSGLEAVYACAAKRKSAKLDERKLRIEKPLQSPYQVNLRKGHLLCRDVDPEAVAYTKRPSLNLLDLRSSPLGGHAAKDRRASVCRLGPSTLPMDILKAVRKAELVVVSSWRHLQAMPSASNIPSGAWTNGQSLSYKGMELSM